MPRRALIILGLLFLLLGALGVRVYHTQLELAESREQNQLLSIARLKVEQIAAWRQERLGDAGVLSANWRLLTGFSDWLKGAAAPGVQRDLTRYIEALQHHYGYRDYLLIDAAGRVRLQSGAPSAITLETEAQAALAEVRQSREPRLTDLHTDTAFPYPHLGLIVPFFEGEAPAGALILVIDARQTLYPLLQSWPVSSASAEALLVRREGDDALFLNEVRYQTGSALRLRVPLTQIEIPPVQAIQGAAKVVEGRDYRGIPVLAALAPVPNSMWWVVAKEDRQEFYAGVWREAALASGILLALLALTGAVLGLVWQRRQRQQTQWLLKAQAAERDSLAQFRLLFEQARDGILLLTPEHRVLDANPAALTLLGYGREALSGLSLPDLLVPDEHARLAIAVAWIMAGEPHRGEWRHRRADGATFLAQVTAQRLDDDRYFATLRDVTRQRELEAAEREAARRLRLILTAATDGLWDWNLLTGEDFHSPRYRELLGYGPGELPDTAAGFEAIVHPDDLPRVNAAQQAHLERREPYQVELRLRTKQGDYRWFVSRGQAEWDENGQPLRMAGFITDITERKRAERELRLLRAIVDHNKDTVFITRPDASFQYVNEAACRALDYTREELLGGMTVSDIDPIYDTSTWDRHWLDLKAAGSLDIETLHRSRSGRVFPVEVNITLIEHEGQEFNCGIIRDISERKAAAETLRQSEARLDYALTQSHIGAWTMNLVDYSARQTLEHDRLFGYEVPQTDWNYDRFRAHVLPEDWDALDAHLQATVRQGGTLVLECRIRRVDGAIRWVRIVGDYQPPQAGEAPRYAGIIQDITEAKALEASLRAELLLREQLQQTSENIPGVIYTLRLSPDGRMAMPYAGAKLLDLYGYPPEAVTEDVGPLIALVHPDDAERIRASIEASAETLTLFRQTWRINHPARGIVWIEGISSPSRGDDGSIIWHGFLSDVTERKALDVALQEAGERYANLLRATKDGFWLVEAGSGRLLDVNDAAVSLSGYTREEMLALRVTDLDIDFQGEKYIAQIQRIRAAGWGLFESRIRHKDGRIIPVEVSVIPEVGDHKILAFIRDISERRRAEQALRDSEFRWQFAIEGAGDGLWDWDVASGICFYSQRWKAMIGYAEDEIGTSLDEWTQRVHPEDWNHVQATWQAHLDGTMPQHVVEYRLRHKDGSWVWILGRGQVSERDAAGQPLRVIGTHTDITPRKRMEAALVELNASLERKVNERTAELATRTAELARMSERFELAMQVTSDGLWDCDLQAEKAYCNANYFAMLGYGPTELGDNVADVLTNLLPPEEREAIIASIRQRFATEGGHESEFRMRAKDGSYRWIFARGRVIDRDVEGRPRRAIGTHIDITARKEADAALRALSNYSRRLIETSLDPLVTISPEGRILDVNSATERVTGCPREQLIGSDFSSYFTEPDQARAGYEQVFAEGFVTDYPLAIRHADGHVTDVLYNASVYRNDAGEVAGVFAAARDVTERRRQEQALRESEARFRHLADAAPVLIWMSGQDKLCYYFNHTWLDFTGRTLEQEFGNGWFEGVHADDADACMRTYLESFEARRPFSMEYRLRRHDGEYRWLRDDGAPRFDGQGRFLGYIGSCIDITEGKRAEEVLQDLNVTLERKVAERTTQLAEAKAAAEAAARSKSEFLANMSHEIRTPMNAILGLTQILEREPLTPDQRDMLQKIGDSGAGLLHIINDILDFSKIEAGQLKVEHYPFDLPPLLSLLESLMTGSAVGRGIELRIEPPVGLPGPVIGDPLRIKQILLNLVSNAIKFTEQGTVTVRVLPLALTETVARLRFEVSDTGIGIAPEALAKLFQPFTQADASTTRRFGGTGLGLSICKRLVELMGGAIGATSELGGGSTFWFELPFERAAAATVTAGTPAEESAAPAPAGPRLQGLKVLAVDDNRINLFMLERALKLEGASVQLAADGQQALQILEADPRGFEVVLMDVQMPVMDGLTATRLIREHAELHKLPVIALTAGVMAEERERAAAAGVTGFLAKPLDLAAMVAMLRPYAPAMDAEPPPAQS